MGEADAVFCSLFRDDPEAAMLACDEAGLFPEELLHLPKAVFFIGVQSEEQGNIRYNMRERFRQEMFRKVFGIKKAILLKGDVMQRWIERNEIFPEAPGIPDVSKLRRKIAEGHVGSDGSPKSEGEDFDTESEDDGLDEHFRPKPKVLPQPSAAPAVPPPTTTTVKASPWLRQQPQPPSTAPATAPPPSRGAASRKSVEPLPPPKPPIPQLPKEPPRCRVLTPRALEREGKLLEVSRKRLARYGTQIERAVEMIHEREHERSPQRQNAVQLSTSHATTNTPANPATSWAVAVTPSGSVSNSVLSGALPRIPLSHLEAKRQLSTLVHKAMVDIAQSAISFNTFREEMEQQEEEEQEKYFRKGTPRSDAFGNTSQASAQLQQSRELWAAQAEARRKREEEQRQRELEVAEAYEKYTAEKAERTQRVLNQRHHKHLLSNEVQRMRQIFAQEKRDCLTRREEARVSRIVARSEPKHTHAEMVLAEKQFLAQQKKQQHVQLELLRRELKQSVNNMNARCEWEVPKVLEALMASSTPRGGSGTGGAQSAELSGRVTGEEY